MVELGFPPYQRSHLNSKTNQTFLKILPLFNQISTPSQTLPNAEKLLSQNDDEIEEGEICDDDREDNTKHTPIPVADPVAVAIPENLQRKKDSTVKTKRVITEQRKEKKKANKRKQRAEKDRESGVKRLKLLPNIKPTKTVNYCKYYLNGKCQKGDTCKFSHDTTPLTKLKPCNFFALKKCLKGDDCPYDHELAKYPCNNFTTKGYCSRGSSCSFSHKVTPVNDLSPLPLSGVTKQADLGAVRSESKPAEKVLSEPKGQCVLPGKPPAQAPKGIRFLSFGKTSIDNNLGRKPNFNFGKSQLAKITSHPAPSVSKARTCSQYMANDQSKVLNDQPSLLPYPLRSMPTVSSILQEFLFNGK